MGKNFAEKVYLEVSKISEGNFLSYKELAKKIGRPNAYRAVANILAKNKDLKIPCHRVVKNDNSIGGYRGFYKNKWEKAALLLREGAVLVMPTDTIYGILGSALNQKPVEKIYRFRKRNPSKPAVVLISSLSDLKKFGVEISSKQRKILTKIWPGKITAILRCSSNKFFYIHRGLKTIAFRMPAKKELLKIISISGPLIAPSANPEGLPPAKNIREAEKYFGRHVIYYGSDKVGDTPSTIIDLQSKPFKIIRKAGGYNFLRTLI